MSVAVARAAAILGAVTALGLAGCHRERGREHVGTVVGPPLTAAPADASVPPRAPLPPPVTARFVDLTPEKQVLSPRACDESFIAVVRGQAHAAGESLGAGDVLVLRGALPLELSGGGLAVAATVRPPGCDDASPPSGTGKQVVRASSAPALVWADGKMRAHLDVVSPLAPDAYLGRLEGSAPVAEHAHEASWEVLCAVEAAGTLTLGGKEERLGPRGVVVVPPGVTHSWRPDAGSTLVAVQIYAPPGPEQRFKKLAEAAKK